MARFITLYVYSLSAVHLSTRNAKGSKSKHALVQLLLKHHLSLLALFLLSLLERLLHQIDQLPGQSEQVAKAKAPPSNTNSVDEEVNQRPIANAEGKEDTEVLPLVARHHIESRQVINTRTVRAVATVRRSIRVGKVAGRRIGESGSVGTASHSGWWVEESGFRWCALNGCLAQGSGEDTTDPVCTGVDVVHPVAPEDVDLLVGPDDTVEEREHDEEEGEDV